MIYMSGYSKPLKIVDNENYNNRMEDTSLDIIRRAQEYYYRNKDNITILTDIITKYTFARANTDFESDMIILFDLNGDELVRSRFEVMGRYDSSSHLWTWAWAIPNAAYNTTHISRRLLEYGFKLSPKTESFLRAEFVKSEFILSDLTDIDIHCQLASYITKKRYILSDTVSIPGNKVIYILLDEDVLDDKIKELHELYD